MMDLIRQFSTRFRGAVASQTPPLSAPNTSVAYHDIATQRLVVSENAGPFVPVGAGSGDVSSASTPATVDSVPTFDATGKILSETGLTVDVGGNMITAGTLQTGAADVAALSVDDGAQGGFLDLADGTAAALGPAGEARITYDDTTKMLEVSIDGAAYAPIGGGGDPTQIVLADNTANAFRIYESVIGRPYIAIDTLDGAERIEYGNNISQVGHSFFVDGNSNTAFSVVDNSGTQIIRADTTANQRVTLCGGAYATSITVQNGIVAAFVVEDGAGIDLFNWSTVDDSLNIQNAVNNGATRFFGSGTVQIDGQVRLPNYTVAQAVALSATTGSAIYVSDEVGGATLAFYDGANFLRVQDRAIISA